MIIGTQKEGLITSKNKITFYKFLMKVAVVINTNKFRDQSFEKRQHKQIKTSDIQTLAKARF